jgi:hypothetical protein
MIGRGLVRVLGPVFGPLVERLLIRMACDADWSVHHPTPLRAGFVPTRDGRKIDRDASGPRLRAARIAFEAPRHKGVAMPTDNPPSGQSPAPVSRLPQSDQGTSVSDSSETSGEANPMAEAPAEPTEAQAEQAAEQDEA